MQSKTGKRILAAVLSGCMMIQWLPTQVKAAGQAGQGGSLEAVFTQAAAGHESMLTLTADSDVNGEREVKISGYMPKQEYVQDGLVLWLDGIDNVGAGIHDSQAEAWTDLTDQTPIAINREDKDDTEGTNTFTDTAFQLHESKVFLPDKVAQTVNGDAYTVEIVTDAEGYSGYERAYSPLMTVDEGEDSWSIFVRTVGKTMELKQGANSLRMRTDFENVFDTTSAIVFQKNQESAWYANGEKKSTFTSGNNASARKVILGGRLRDNSGNVSDAYVTSASYHAIRIYNRALSEGELQQNAEFDQMRYYGKERKAPDVQINGTSLSEEGATVITAVFEDGVARIPVVSNQVGTVSMEITVDGVSGSASLSTKDVLDLTLAQVPDSVYLTGVSETAAVSVIRNLLKEQVEAALTDSFFAQDGGSIAVSGMESPYQVELTLGEKTKTKSVAAVIEYADSTDMDILKRAMADILKGEFSFQSAQEVTAQALTEQINEKLEEGVTAIVAWDEGKQYYELTLLKGEEQLTSPLYVNSEVSISGFTEEFLQGASMRKGSSTVMEVRDGAICVSATQSMTYENVVLPIFNYGRDFMLSVDLKMKDAVDTGRWAALSYGVTPNHNAGENGYTFWQMAVRKNATAGNGVECATRTESDSWSVPATGSYTENLNPESTYNLKVVVKGKYVYEYINDQLMVRYAAQEQMRCGKVAFTFDRVTAEYSNLVMTSEIPGDLDTEFTKTENGYDADIYEPATGLVMAPVVVSEYDQKSVSELVDGQRRPSTVLRTVSENMTVMDDNQEITLAEYAARAQKKALVGFRIENMEVANAFADYVKENNLTDIMVISQDPEILLAACDRMAGVHGMLDFSGYEGELQTDLIDWISETNKANSRILVLPWQLATEENIQYIQARAISVWVRTGQEQTASVILNGADGILTEDFERAYDVIESFDENTQVLTRNTVITAHRGFHMTAPENSERAAKLAVEAGADAIECDVHLTADGEVVVNHDETTGRLMDKNLVVADSTLAQLQELTFQANAQEGDKIPTLRELFEAADEADPDDDILHVIEIKTSDPRVIEPMVSVIRQMHMEDRVVFISFHDAQLELVRQAMPEVAAGELNSVCSASDDVAAAMKKLCDRMDGHGYFYNCNYGAQNGDITRAARFRGIYVHPWTVDALDIFENEYVDNYHGITTNRTDYAKDYLNKVETEKDGYALTAGDQEGVVIGAKAYTRGGVQIEGAGMTMKQLSGTPVTFDSESGVCYAQSKGEAVILIGASYQLAGTGKTYTVYSAPVTLEVAPSDKEAMEEALQKAKEAQKAAEEAQIAAEEAEEEAAKARKAAETAAAKAETALADAQAAAEKAEAAKIVAEQLEAAAGEDKAAAEAARAAAVLASNEAEAARQKAEAAASAAELSASRAENAETAAETARTAAEAAKTAAETAKDDAVTAAELAQKAKEEAKTAKESAVTARKEAQNAAGLAKEAQKAAEAAKEAAQSQANVAEAARKAAQAARDAAEAAKTAAEEILEKAKAEAKKQLEEARKALERAEKVEKQLTAAVSEMSQSSFKSVRVAIKKLDNTKKKQLTVTWKKVEGAEGYVIQYATKSSFKGKKTVTVKDGAAVTKTVKKLRTGKKYYVRIKAYKTVNGKKIYTRFSAKKAKGVK